MTAHSTGRARLLRERRLALSTGVFLASLVTFYGCSSETSPSDAGAGGSSGIVDGGSSGGSAADGGSAAGGSSSGDGGDGASDGGAGSGGDASSGGSSSGGDGAGGGASGGVAGIGGSTSKDLPELLSETGLFTDMAARELATGVMAFTPKFILWTDGATKERWIYIPEGEKIDTSDMDNWQYPVGTRLWKDFSRDGKLIETRYITRVRTGGIGWKGVAYIWNEDGTDAVLSTEGQSNVAGTEHDVPNEDTCIDCHADRADWPLGFSAVILSHEGEGVTLTSLIADDLLTAPPAGPFTLPGTEEEQAVLGYLHVNCGSCHRYQATGEDRSGGMMTWLNVGQLGSVEETDTYTTLINQEIGSPDGIDSHPIRVTSGDATLSEVFRRITMRGTEDMMPPMGSEIVDPDVKIIEDWINALAPAE